MNRRPRQMGVCRYFANEGFLAPSRIQNPKFSAGAFVSSIYRRIGVGTLLVVIRQCQKFNLQAPTDRLELSVVPRKWAHSPCHRLGTYRKFLNFTSNLGILNSNILHERLEWEHYSRKKVASIGRWA